MTLNHAAKITIYIQLIDEFLTIFMSSDPLIFFLTQSHNFLPQRHKCAPLPTVCLLYVTVPRNGQNNTFRDRNIEEICPFPQQRRGMFCFKNYTFNWEKGHFLGVGIIGEQAPPAPWFHCPWLCPFRGNEKSSRVQFPGSAVAIRALMWKAKCPNKA